MASIPAFLFQKKEPQNGLLDRRRLWMKMDSVPLTILLLLGIKLHFLGDEYSFF